MLAKLLDHAEAEDRSLAGVIKDVNAD